MELVNTLTLTSPWYFPPWSLWWQHGHNDGCNIDLARHQAWSKSFSVCIYSRFGILQSTPRAPWGIPIILITDRQNRTDRRGIHFIVNSVEVISIPFCWFTLMTSLLPRESGSLGRIITISFIKCHKRHFPCIKHEINTNGQGNVIS